MSANAESGNATFASSVMPSRAAKTLIERLIAGLGGYLAVRPNALAALRMIILSVGKESFPRDRCRRSIGSGFRCRADGPRRKERTSDQ